MNAMDLATRASVMAALGDPIRLQTMDLLASGDLSPDALIRELQVPGNLLSHHLGVLERAGLIHRVASQHDRRRVYVQARTEALDGLLPAPRPTSASRIVFVCTRNSARSVLAEALWRRSSAVPCTSAGTRPAPRIHPRAQKAAARHELELAGHGPQAFAEIAQSGDFIVSVCDAVNEELVGLPNHRIHWSVPDPVVTDTDPAFDLTVDELGRRIDLLAPVLIGPEVRTRSRRSS